MAGDFFLMIDGIEGESRVAGHEGQIDVESWSWGEANPANPVTGGGGGVSRVSVNPLQISKSLDRASPTLMKYCAQLRQIEQLELFALKSGGDEALQYFKITLRNAYITSYNTGGFEGGGGLKEDVTFVYEEIAVEYDEQAAGGVGSGVVSWNYNAMTNVTS